MKNKLTRLFTLLFIAFLFTKCDSDVEFKENELNDDKKNEQIITSVDKLTIDGLNIDKSSKKWATDLYADLDNKSIWIENGKITDSIAEFFNYLNSDVALNLPIGHLSYNSFGLSDELVLKEIVSVLRCAEFLSLKDTTLINHSTNTLNKLTSYV